MESKKAQQNNEINLFWQNHFKSLKLSGLNRKEYCVKNNLNYDQFGYFISKWAKQMSAPKIDLPLIPVTIKNEASSLLVASNKLLCSVSLSNGLVLKIHDVSVLPFILNQDH